MITNEGEIRFKGYNPFIKQLRTDKGWRVELEVSQDQYDLIKDLPKLEAIELEITIKAKNGN